MLFVNDICFYCKNVNKRRVFGLSKISQSLVRRKYRITNLDE